MLSDCNKIPQKSLKYLYGLDYLILDCLKMNKHPSHFNYYDALELAKKASYKPLLEINDVNKFFDRSDCVSLEDYLEAFIHTTALMNTYENLERIAFEAAEDMHNNGINLSF